MIIIQENTKSMRNNPPGEAEGCCSGKEIP
jgi:hypothetical protein